MWGQQQSIHRPHQSRPEAFTTRDTSRFRMVYLTFWALALASLIVGIGVVTYRPVGMIRYVLRDHPIMNAGFLAILLGMSIGFFTNDSGVVMAATGFIYLAFPLMLLVLREMADAPQAILNQQPPSQTGTMDDTSA